MFQLANTNFPPALPPHVEPPLILEHPSLHPLILAISDAEFRTGHLADAEPPPQTPVAALSQQAHAKPHVARGLALCFAVAALIVIFSSAPFAATVRDARVPSVATDTLPASASAEAIPVIVVESVVITAPAVAVSSTPRDARHEPPVVATPAAVPKPATPAPAPTSDAPYGVGDPGF